MYGISYFRYFIDGKGKLAVPLAAVIAEAPNSAGRQKTKGDVVADLRIEGSYEEQFAIMKTAVIQHHSAINGNGQPGLLDFMSGQKAQYRLIIAMISVIMLLLTLLLVIEGNRQMKEGILHVDAPTVTAQSTTTSDWRH